MTSTLAAAVATVAAAVGLPSESELDLAALMDSGVRALARAVRLYARTMGAALLAPPQLNFKTALATLTALTAARLIRPSLRFLPLIHRSPSLSLSLSLSLDLQVK